MLTIRKTIAFFIFSILFFYQQTTFANTVVYEDARLVSDNKTHFFTEKFFIHEAGTYDLVLTDFEFPSAFTTLNLALTSSTEKLGSLFEAGHFTFNADRGRHYLGLIYQTDPNEKIGMYGIKISKVDITAVPLPAAVWLLISGLMFLAIYKRPQQRRP